jgi:hypothetical protein
MSSLRLSVVFSENLEKEFHGEIDPVAPLFFGEISSHNERHKVTI